MKGTINSSSHEKYKKIFKGLFSEPPQKVLVFFSFDCFVIVLLMEIISITEIFTKHIVTTYGFSKTEKLDQQPSEFEIAEKLHTKPKQQSTFGFLLRKLLNCLVNQNENKSCLTIGKNLVIKLKLPFYGNSMSIVNKKDPLS